MYFGEDFDFSGVCRTCLGTRDLNPLFKKTAFPKKFSRSMLKVTGLKIGINDGLPQNICKKCLQHIKTSVTFQINCRAVEAKLKMQREYQKFIENKEMDAAENSKEFIESINIKTEEPPEETPEERFEEPPEEPKKPQVLHTDALNLLVDINEFEINYDILKTSEITEPEIKYQDYLIKSEIDQQINEINYDTLKPSEITGPGIKYQDDKIKSERDQQINCKVWGKETVECPTCKVKLQRASLKFHTKVKHAGLGPVCDHCGNQFSNNFRLHEHKRSKHGYEKFKCTQCDFQSATTLGLANHQRRHSGEKPFVCELCGASFHAAYLISQHKQSHRTERSHKCNVCPASFKTNNGLHTHRAACHAAVGRHVCSECKRGYSCRLSLVRHMRTVHRFESAEPVQPQPSTDIESDRRRILPTAAERSPEVNMRVDPVQSQSWTDIE